MGGSLMSFAMPAEFSSAPASDSARAMSWPEQFKPCGLTAPLPLTQEKQLIQKFKRPLKSRLLQWRIEHGVAQYGRVDHPLWECKPRGWLAKLWHFIFHCRRCRNLEPKPRMTDRLNTQVKALQAKLKPVAKPVEHNPNVPWIIADPVVSSPAPYPPTPIYHQSGPLMISKSGPYSFGRSHRINRVALHGPIHPETHVHVVLEDVRIDMNLAPNPAHTLVDVRDFHIFGLQPDQTLEFGFSC